MSQAVIGWLIAIVVFIVAEAATVTLVSVWFIGGAVCALVAAILGAGLGVQRYFLSFRRRCWRSRVRRLEKSGQKSRSV